MPDSGHVAGQGDRLESEVAREFDAAANVVDWTARDARRAEHLEPLLRRFGLQAGDQQWAQLLAVDVPLMHGGESRVLRNFRDPEGGGELPELAVVSGNDNDLAIRGR